MAEQDFNRLLKTITLLNAELTRAKINLDILKNVPPKGGNTAFKQMQDEVKNLSALLVKARAEMDALRAKGGTAGVAPKGGAVGYIPGGAPKQTPKEQDPTTKLRAQLLQDEIRNAAKRNSLDSSNLTKKQQAEEARLQAIRKSVLADQKYARAVDLARQKGFEIGDLRGVYNRGTGIDRLQFRKFDAQGTRRDLDLYTSPTGKVTPGISNQFRTFGQGVLRDIGELTKWSIALAAIYGPLRKLQELVQTMIENQTKLAEASIAVNSAFVSQNAIFDIAAEAASRAGEEVTGVIDAFTLAYRAAGGSGDEIERMAIATTLLNDSLTLSKLSTLDQAVAIDTLAAALRQTSGDLSAGIELLDSWVRVTKVANVDLGTLATGFAVLGDAAEAAGIGVDELNGVVAVIAETGISSGRETAAIARAIVSGFQSDKAREDLDNLGIAVTDTTGQMRPFLEVMQEIYNLRQTGALSDTQFSDLTLSLGGGTRRQAAYATFIENFDRVFSIADQSRKASGDAEAALAKQLETIQTALTRLGNAFEELAQTMGTEGGFLGIITEIVTGITGLVKAFDSLVGILGKATPALAAFLATSVLLRTQGVTNVQAFVGEKAAGLAGVGPYDKRLAQVTGAPAPGPVRQTGQFIKSNVLGTNWGSGISQGLLLSAIPALMNFQNEDDRFGKLKAGANVAGGIAGGVIGSLVAGSPLVGAAIGTSISEAFVNSTIARKTDLFGYQERPTVVEGRTAQQELLVENPEEALQQAEIGLFKSVGFGNEAFGRFLTSGQDFSKTVDKLNDLIAQGGDVDKYLNDLSSKYPQVLRNLAEQGVTSEIIGRAAETGGRIEYSPGNYVYNQASAQARRDYDEALSSYLAANQEQADISTPFGEMVGTNREALGGVIQSVAGAFREQLSEERLQGDIKGTAYSQQLRAIGGFDTRALQYYTALGDTFISMNKDVNDVNEAFEAFAFITTKGSQESVQEITRITGEIQELINLLGDPALNEKVLTERFGGEAGAREQLETLQATGANLITDVYNQARLSQFDLPEIKGDREKPLQTGELQSVVQLARQMQDEFYKGFLDVPDELYDSMKKNFDEWAQIVEDSGDVFYSTISEIDPQFFQQALTKLIEEGKIGSQEVSPFDIQQLDMTSGQGANLQSTIDYFSQYLSSNFPQYEQNPEEFGVIFSDYVTDVLHGDNLAVQLALDKLVELNQKQLDGQYNIPEGATFWVPLTAAYYRPQNQDTGLGGTIDTSSLDSSAGNLDDSASALDNSAAVITAAMEREDALTAEILNYFKQGGVIESEDKRLLIPEAQPQEILPYDPSQIDFSNFFQDEGLKAFYEAQNQALGRTPSVLDTRSDFSQLSEEEGGSVLDTFFGINTITEGLKTLFQSLEQVFSGSAGVGSADNITGQETAPAVSAKLDFQIDNTTQLTVDGRVLASVITPYLASDLLRIEASQGTITKRYVI